MNTENNMDEPRDSWLALSEAEVILLFVTSKKFQNLVDVSATRFEEKSANKSTEDIENVATFFADLINLVADFCELTTEDRAWLLAEYLSFFTNDNSGVENESN